MAQAAKQVKAEQKSANRAAEVAAMQLEVKGNYTPDIIHGDTLETRLRHPSDFPAVRTAHDYSAITAEPFGARAVQGSTRSGTRGFRAVLTLGLPVDRDDCSRATCVRDALSVVPLSSRFNDSWLISRRHRLRACQETGATLKTRKWDGKGSLVEFVLSLNLDRRHLTSSQRAALSSDVVKELELEAKERKRLLSGTRSNPGTIEQVPQTFGEAINLGRLFRLKRVRGYSTARKDRPRSRERPHHRDARGQSGLALQRAAYRA